MRPLSPWIVYRDGLIFLRSSLILYKIGNQAIGSM